MVLAAPFLAFVGLLLPLMAAASARQLRGLPVTGSTLRALLVQALLIQGLLAGLALLAASGARLPVSVTLEADAATILAAAGLVALALVATWLGPQRPPRAEEEAVRRLLGRVPLGHPGLLLGVAVASVAEEIAYRAVLTDLLALALDRPEAIATSAALFGLAHAAQGGRGVVLAGVAGLGLQGLAALGGLGLAIAAHFAYDVGSHVLVRSQTGGSDDED